MLVNGVVFCCEFLEKLLIELHLFLGSTASV